MVWHANPHLASFACGGVSAVVPGLNASVAASYSNTAYPHPPLSANRLASFTMKSTSCCVPGIVVFGKNWLFFGFQWIFAIRAPSGNGLPLAGIPAWKAAIIAGFPRITEDSFSLWLTAIVCQ